MDSAISEDGAGAPAERPPLHDSAANGLKIVIVGGFGVGKTTMVRAVSEIRPLNTEETMTQAGEGIDDPSAVREKTTTTIAFDFGRIGIDHRTVLYLFGAPGQERFWFLWDRLFAGTLGAVVLVDTRRLEDSWYAIDRLEQHGTPFVVARNDFGGPRHTREEIRAALDLDDEVPLIDCDARSRESSRDVLVALVDHVYGLAAAQAERAALRAEPQPQ
ncbi:ATP/GTP-binding protein [Streptomyces sp. JJ36]|uniref:GTP-binding protein n=1 Tax=Streptomyces sp. JJ36 TaxID=2736645 RepID=UPI001F2C97B2|nr:ATP/GTP-binding protein [Streptomyces sp. JJ36]MCF6524968.1 ATP/GTP-binding protein [Streptomyces sp. JJ36]